MLEARLKYLLELFENMKGEFHRPRLARFYGFKTNMGCDGYPSPKFSFTHLFEPTYEAYSSDSMSGAAIVQGVYIPEDPGKFYENDKRIMDLIDGKLKVLKQRDPIEARTVPRDVQRA